MGDQTGEHEAAANIAEGLVHICHQRDQKAANHIRPFLSFLACFTVIASTPLLRLNHDRRELRKRPLCKDGAPKSIGYWALYMQRLRSWRLRHGARCTRPRFDAGRAPVREKRDFRLQKRNKTCNNRNSGIRALHSPKETIRAAAPAFLGCSSPKWNLHLTGRKTE